MEGAVYPVILICLFLVLLGSFLFFIRRLRNRTPESESKQADCIRTGNISVFFDREGNITIILYAKDKQGVGKAVGKPIFVNVPYTSEKLGKTIRQAMKMCEGAEPCSDVELMSALRENRWKEFSEGKRNMSIFYAPDHGIVVNTTRRRLDGSYQFNVFGFEKVIPAEVDDLFLGNTVISHLPKCRS